MLIQLFEIWGIDSLRLGWEKDGLTGNVYKEQIVIISNDNLQHLDLYNEDSLFSDEDISKMYTVCQIKPNYIH